MKYHVTRSRLVNEGIVVDATSTTDAVEKARKTKRKDWSHVESKKRSNYNAVKVAQGSVISHLYLLGQLDGGAWERTLIT